MERSMVERTEKLSGAFTIQESTLSRNRKLQGILPILLSISFVITISILVYLSLPSWSGWNKKAALTLVGFYIGWLGIEGQVAVSETKKNETHTDSGTLEIYAFGRAATVITALAVPLFWPQTWPETRPEIWPEFWNENTPWRLNSRSLGILIFLSGVTFRLWAIHTLGRFYSHRVRIAVEHFVIQAGPYQWIRHPAYTGMLIAHAGFVLFFFHPIALAVFLCIFLPAVVVRILTEETTLLSEIPGYAEYAMGRKRLLPFIW